MKQRLDWQVWLGVFLISLTAIVYYVHYLIFRDIEHIFIYFVGDVAFVFFEVLLVTLVIYRLLHHRERKALENKINMLIGAFFSEMGTELLRRCADLDIEAHRIAPHLATPEDWSESAFLDIRRTTGEHAPAIETHKCDLPELSRFLQEHKPFILDLMRNQSLLQNEPFTNLVWAVFHLTKELEHCGDLSKLPAGDCRHLTEDVERVYQLLVGQWMVYVKHLKSHYPYLFSLASRTNPFRRTAPVEVK